MSTPRDNDKATLFFRFNMLEKLNQNNHKAHWNAASLEYLFSRMNEEVEELRAEILALSGDGNDSCVLAAMDECADVANFAMMIWDNLRHGIIDGSDDAEQLEPQR